MFPKATRSRRIDTIFHGVRTGLMILFYYVFSIGITFYNRWMFQKFRYPIATTIVHFFTTFTLSGLTRYFLWIVYKRKPVNVSWSIFLTKVFPTGMICSIDVGLSNWSFMYVTVSLYVMTKSTAILFTLAFGLLLGLEKTRWNIIVIISSIAFGLFLFVYKSTQFSLIGFILCFSAAILAGAKNALSQVLCQKKEIGLGNPIDSVFHLTPPMVVGLIPIFFIRETDFFTNSATFAAMDMQVLLHSLSLMAFGGVLAFFLLISEYIILTYTSALTLVISGIFKELVTLLLASHFNGDVITGLNWIGCFMCIVGICVHVKNKYEETMDKSRVESSEAEVSHLLANEMLQDSDTSDIDEFTQFGRDTATRKRTISENLG